MNLNNYINFLNEYKISTGSLLGFYSFTGLSGSVIYNDIYGDAHTNDCLDPRKYPLFLSCSGDGTYVSGDSVYLNGESFLRASDTIDFNSWTIFLNFKHNKYSNGIGYTLFSNITEDEKSGVLIGINDSNRIYFEYPVNSTSEFLRETVSGELNNQNIISIGKRDKYLDIVKHDPLNNENFVFSYKLQGYNNSNIWSFGNDLFDYKPSGFSGFFDNLIIHKDYLTINQRNEAYESLISTGIQNSTISISTSTYNRITGYIYGSVVTGTGITGYEYDGTSELDLKCSTLDICSISGITGELTGKALSLLTSVDNVTVNNRSINVKEIFYNDDYLLGFGNDTIIFQQTYEFDENDNFEIYNYRENFKLLNLTPTFFRSTKNLIVDLESANDQFNLYLNGIFQVKGSGENGQVSSGDYVYSSYQVDSDEYYEGTSDDFIYDIYSGSKIFINVEAETGFITLTGSEYFNKDIFFNGQKFMSGVGYEVLGSDLIIDLTDHGTGTLYFVDFNNFNFDYYTGNSTKIFTSNYGLNNPIIWVNGLRQTKFKDYIILNDNSLISDYYFRSGAYMETIYSGNENLLNM